MQRKLSQIFFELTDVLGLLNYGDTKLNSQKTLTFFSERQIFDMIWATKNLAHKIIKMDILPPKNSDPVMVHFKFRLQSFKWRLNEPIMQRSQQCKNHKERKKILQDYLNMGKGSNLTTICL